MEWKPKFWISFLLGIIVQPFVFLYLNHLGLFSLYLCVSIFTAIVDWYFSSYLTLGLVLVIVIHSYFIVRHYNICLPRAWFSKWWGLVAIHAGVLISVTLFRAFLYEPFTIPARSMNPSLSVGDYIVVEKQGYGTYGTFGVILVDNDKVKPELMQKGNVYAFYPPNMDAPHVARLIGLPGDRISFKGSNIQLNGEELPISFVSGTTHTETYQEVLANNSYLIQRAIGVSHSFSDAYVIPDNAYFFVGDNRDNSADSRLYGAVDGNRILGKLVLTLKPNDFTLKTSLSERTK
ncbi:signal peptidase I [Agarivorans albus]|uniref:Signal peptidase I n=1 Tax=Agarivorans albus MKT 106 TaxID=1331007 RepID=R9PP73_AGAAL|nr:signal peptidase I [Agarivorans albus]GAD03110.1 signal peptidase I [Agarivorans albus MKT 106]